MKLQNLILVHSLLTGLLASCGTANVNKIFGAKDDSYASLLQRAQFSYDTGDYSTAEDLANQAYSNSENNGDAGVLLGSVYLSQAGIDIFQLISKLSKLSSSSSTTTTTTTDACATTSSNANAANVLSELSCRLLNLSADEKKNLGKVTTFSGLAPLGITDIYIPNTVDDALRKNISILTALDKGIRKLCPFIDRSQVLSQSIDERHVSTTICPDRTASSFNSAKAHIAFALLHLIESLVFQQGVLIDGVSNGGASSSTSYNGISTLSSKISTASFTSVTSFASTVSAFKTVVDSVFDTTNPKSQIALALNGFVMVSQSFTVAGVPSSVTSAITKQLTKLKETAAKIKGSATGADSTYQTQALKGQINETYAKTLTAKINAQCPTASSCASDKTSLCSSYSSISQGVDSTKVSAPTICQ